MSNSDTYKFRSPGRGSLELEIAESKRDFYQPQDLGALSFSIKGLEPEDPATKSFFFYEWQVVQYSYIIENSTSFVPPFELRINDRKANVSKQRENNHLLAGAFSFDDVVGETKIEITDSRNKQVFELYTEVFPQKMDYKSDYKAMMADISEIVQNLAYDSLKDTFSRSKAKLKGTPTESEWWNILDALFEQLVINLGVIKRQPKHEIRKSEKVLPIEKIKTSSKKNINWMIKNGHYANGNERGISISAGRHFSHALSCKKYVTYDIYENRFVAWAIKNIIEQLRQYKNRIEKESSSKDYIRRVERMKMYQSQLQGLLHENPFNEVGEFEKRSHFSTSLTRGTGYRDFMHIYLLLNRGLELSDNDIFKIEQKNISTLYEYWCFLNLVKILKEQNTHSLDYQDLIKVKSGRLKVELKKGNESRVTFKKQSTQETTTIYFNREFIRDDTKVFTYNQRPDYSIKFKRKGFSQPFWYLLDAKYRFEEKQVVDGAIQKFNVPQDAIGQLHRYRDAILHTEPTNSTYRSAIKNLGGIILYPYPLSEKEFENNVYYKSIGQVNIGALPFLPGKSGLVSDLLNELINKRLPEEHFEQFVEMDSSEYQKKRAGWKEWVTIGVLPKDYQQQRLDFINREHIYHVPFVKNLNSKLYLSKKILVCKSGTKEAILYDVKDWEILTDKDLTDLGTLWNHRYEKYVAFHLANGKVISTPGNITPRKFRYATSEGLRKYLDDPKSNKNYFYLTNADAARLYEELKNRNHNFQINWVEDDTDPSLVEFKLDTMKIYSSNKYLDLHYTIEDNSLPLKKILDLIPKLHQSSYLSSA